MSRVRDAEDEPREADPLKTTLALAAVAVLAARVFRQRLSMVQEDFRAQGFDRNAGVRAQVWAENATRQMQAAQGQIEQQFAAQLARYDATITTQVERQLQQINAPRPRATGDLVRTAAVALAAQVVAKLTNAVTLARSSIERAALTQSEIELNWPMLARQNAKALKRTAADIGYQFEIGTLTALYLSAGVKYARWRTRRDARVRPSHKAREGQIYELAKGLRGIKPGQEPGCRCEPIPLPSNYTT